MARSTTGQRSAKATRKTARGIRVSAAVADHSRNVQRAIAALGDVLSGTPSSVAALGDFAGTVGVSDSKVAAGTVTEVLASVATLIGEAATASIQAVVSGADNYPNEHRAKALGAKKPVPVQAK
jgi:hypothetical protein